jgi:hypothetical protein
MDIKMRIVYIPVLIVRYLVKASILDDGIVDAVEINPLSTQHRFLEADALDPEEFLQLLHKLFSIHSVIV